MEDRWKNHADMENVMIKVRNLHKKFEDLEVLSGIDEHITQGEVVVVIGPSGSGKSTFLRCLNLLETVTEGEITGLHGQRRYGTVWNISCWMV